MNAQQTTAIRELTAQELDEVTGGISFENGVILFMSASLGGALVGAIGHIFEWLFD
jgi:hypothetical protein